MRIISVFSLLLLFVSCTERNMRPTVNYDIPEDSLSVNLLFMDTSKVMIASLPFMFDSTNVLLQPSGLVDIQHIEEFSLRGLKQEVSSEISTMKSEYSSARNEDFYLKSANNNTFSGSINNIYFDDLTTGQQRLLTDKPMLITTIIYLSSINKETGRSYLLYTVYDKDTDKDGQLTTNDMKSLFISNLDGSGFERLTKEDQTLCQTLLVDVANRYYFSALEDTNRDGVFNNGDKYYYYYLAFSTEGYKLVEYNPIPN